ncbi:MAG: hypothetical protein R3E79_14835 [Caldilineaceae bacterium]
MTITHRWRQSNTLIRRVQRHGAFATLFPTPVARRMTGERNALVGERNAPASLVLGRMPLTSALNTPTAPSAADDETTIVMAEQTPVYGSANLAKQTEGQAPATAPSLPASAPTTPSAGVTVSVQRAVSASLPVQNAPQVATSVESGVLSEALSVLPSLQEHPKQPLPSPGQLVPYSSAAGSSAIPKPIQSIPQPTVQAIAVSGWQATGSAADSAPAVTLPFISDSTAASQPGVGVNRKTVSPTEINRPTVHLQQPFVAPVIVPQKTEAAPPEEPDLSSAASTTRLTQVSLSPPPSSTPVEPSVQRQMTPRAPTTPLPAPPLPASTEDLAWARLQTAFRKAKAQEVELGKIRPPAPPAASSVQRQPDSVPAPHTVQPVQPLEQLPVDGQGPFQPTGEGTGGVTHQGALASVVTSAQQTAGAVEQSVGSIARQTDLSTPSRTYEAASTISFGSVEQQVGGTAPSKAAPPADRMPSPQTNPALPSSGLNTTDTNNAESSAVEGVTLTNPSTLLQRSLAAPQLADGPTAEPLMSDLIDTTADALPLDAVWPVQRLTTSADAGQGAEGNSLIPLNAAGEQRPTLPDTVRHQLTTRQTARPTESKIDVIAPRRSRPQPRSAGFQPENTADVAAMAVQRTAQTPHAEQVAAQVGQPTPALVPTEIGPLPADLWTLIGEQPPVTTQPSVVAADQAGILSAQSNITGHMATEEAAPLVQRTAMTDIAQLSSVPVTQAPTQADPVLASHSHDDSTSRLPLEAPEDNSGPAHSSLLTSSKATRSDVDKPQPTTAVVQRQPATSINATTHATADTAPGKKKRRKQSTRTN